MEGGVGFPGQGKVIMVQEVSEDLLTDRLGLEGVRVLLGKAGCSLQAAPGIQETQGEQLAHSAVERQSARFVWVFFFLLN